VNLTTRSRRYLLAIIVIPLGLQLALTVGTPSVGPQQFSGLVALGSGDVVVLDSAHGLLRLSPKTGVQGAWADFPIPEAVGIALKSGGQEEVYLTQYQRWTGEPGSTYLLELDLNGGIRTEWHLPHSLGLLAGVLISPKGSAAYLSRPTRAEIYRLELDSRRTSPSNVGLSQIAAIPRSTTLGALAADAKRDRILAADPIEGVVYFVPASGGTAVKLLGGVGEPSALAIDSATDRLFVSDRAGRKILVVDLGREPVAATVFAAPKEMREPVGLAIGSGGVLWVLNKKPGAVFLFAKDGKLIHTYIL
jgi:hypothetical protein